MTLRKPRRALPHALGQRGDDRGSTGSHPGGTSAWFSVQQEGPNLGLYLGPIRKGRVIALLDLPDDDRAWVIGPRGAASVPWALVGLLSEELDVVHHGATLPALAPAADVLTDPARAVPQGSRVALSVRPDGHAALFSRDRPLLRRCLSGFIADYLDSVGGVRARPPAVPGPLLGALLEPRPPGAWTQLTADLHRRYWVLRLDHGHPDHGVVTEHWVGGLRGGRWRAGWSW